MKKHLLCVGFAALMSLSFVSCNSNDSEPGSYSTTNPIPTYNLFTDTKGQKAPAVTLGTYSYKLELPANTMSLSATSMPGPAGGSIGFTTDPSSFNLSYVDFPIPVLNVDKAEVLTFRTNKINGVSPVSDIDCKLTQAAYAPPADIKVPDYDRFVPTQTFSYTVMNYLYGDWKVRTFWPDMTFCGTTTTSGAGMSEPFSNTKTSYRIVMHRAADNTIENKADVIFYNATFASGMPELTIVLKDLDLEFNAGGYTVKGTSVIPSMLEAGALQEMPSFTFNSIEMAVTGDLTEMNSQFTVAGRFHGAFTGESIKKQ